MSEVHKFYIKGHEVLIDKDKLYLVTRFIWHIRNGYATTNMLINGKRTKIDLHRVIMNAKEGQIIDHINRNTFDNRLINLRFCNSGENQRNRSPSKNGTSKYLGVSIDTKYKKTTKYKSQIQSKGMHLVLGSFSSEIEAARAYNEAAIKYHGEFANLNKI